MLLYPITETKGSAEREGLTVGFTLLFPENQNKNAVGFTVYVQGAYDDLIEVDAEGRPVQEAAD